MSLGVKVTLCKSGSQGGDVGGTVDGMVNAKLPGTDAEPPLRIESARVCPYVIAPAVGHVVTAGVAWFTVILTEALAVA